ncbi:MIP family Ig-specific serine endopeptidase [Mycoplasma parvum]|uniref:DUF31 domain-containing protein n=1 Tax=Mycoplasma parvum str. Indiana TaxID=1403316 RepID=U5NC63_9MOLU|nr:hypothetical protein [Mycoplasma parvum]AGX88880.1 hypothetical protein PRV_00555 [Mycoplasma parvum str. Indiana]
MAFLPLIINGVKLFLVLGVGLGGHQIYGAMSSGKFVDDGYFYHLDKMSSGGTSVNTNENKVYNAKSTISRGNNYFTQEELKNLTTGYWDFDKDLGFTKRINFMKISHQDTAKEIYKMIKDHTVKLAMPCQSGTGWLLDFELPKDNKTYPTKWFIATNLHVINKFRFKNNPYNTSLPITENSISNHISTRSRNYRYKLDSCEDSILNNKSILNLYTEEDINDRDRENNLYSSLLKTHSGNWSYYRNNPFYQWLGLAPTWDRWKNYDAPRIFTTTVKEPKLVYAAVDFLGPRYTVSGHEIKNNSYFKDFGVLEVNFANERQARFITNKVFEKYYKDNISKTNKKYINFFVPELMSKYDPEKLAKSEDRFFMGGYPGSVADNLSFSMNHKFRIVNESYLDQHYNVIPSESKLTFFRNNGYFPHEYNLLNSQREIIPGHVDMTSVDKVSNASKVSWNGKLLSGWGYNYLIDNAFLGRGASGSMVLNQNGEFLGLYRMFNQGLNYGFIEPVRGNWVIGKDGRIILPGFDLIAGTGSNVSSYRTQLEKYSPEIQTYLKNKKNWKFS